MHPCDLSDPDAVEALGADVLAANGRVDVLVSNAGKSIRRSIDLSYERFHDFRRTIDVNYLGPVRLVLALLPSMRERGEGHIVNVSTLGIRMPPTPRWSAYLSSKAAFDVWLRSLAPEVRHDGISCTSIYMSLVHTRMSDPTPTLRNMPGLTPEQAAGLVCRAIVDRPREIEPWWVGATAPALAGRARAMGAGDVDRLQPDDGYAGERQADPGTRRGARGCRESRRWRCAPRGRRARRAGAPGGGGDGAQRHAPARPPRSRRADDEGAASPRDGPGGAGRRVGRPLARPAGDRRRARRAHLLGARLPGPRSRRRPPRPARRDRRGPVGPDVPQPPRLRGGGCSPARASAPTSCS